MLNLKALLVFSLFLKSLAIASIEHEFNILNQEIYTAKLELEKITLELEKIVLDQQNNTSRVNTLLLNRKYLELLKISQNLRSLSVRNSLLKTKLMFKDSKLEDRQKIQQKNEETALTLDNDINASQQNNLSGINRSDVGIDQFHFSRNQNLLKKGNDQKLSGVNQISGTKDYRGRISSIEDDRRQNEKTPTSYHSAFNSGANSSSASRPGSLGKVRAEKLPPEAGKQLLTQSVRKPKGLYFLPFAGISFPSGSKFNPSIPGKYSLEDSNGITTGVEAGWQFENIYSSLEFSYSTYEFNGLEGIPISFEGDYSNYSLDFVLGYTHSILPNLPISFGLGAGATYQGYSSEFGIAPLKIHYDEYDLTHRFIFKTALGYKFNDNFLVQVGYRYSLNPELDMFGTMSLHTFYLGGGYYL